MKDTNYAFCVARIRAVENKLLSKQDINVLVSQKNSASAIEFLSQKGYCNPDDSIETVTKNQGEALSCLLKECVPDKKKLDALYILNDYFNLKAIVKSFVENTDPVSYFLYPSSVALLYTSKKQDSDAFSFLGDSYRKIAESAYNLAFHSRNGKFADVIIDRAAIDRLSDFSKEKDSGLLGEICAFLADSANIKIAFRCNATGQDADFVSEAIGKCNRIDRDRLISASMSDRETLISYLGNTPYAEGTKIYLSKPSEFEKWCDDEIIRKTESSVYTCFGFDPVVSYYYRKNLEIKTVRMILSALKSDIDREIIRERVRTLYA